MLDKDRFSDDIRGGGINPGCYIIVLIIIIVLLIIFL